MYKLKDISTPKKLLETVNKMNEGGSTLQLSPARLIFDESEISQGSGWDWELRNIIDLAQYVTVKDSNGNLKEVNGVVHGLAGAWEMNYIDFSDLEVGDKVEFRISASELGIVGLEKGQVGLNLPIILFSDNQDEEAMQQEVGEKYSSIMPLINIKAITNSGEEQFLYEITDVVIVGGDEGYSFQLINSNAGKWSYSWEELVIEVNYQKPLYNGAEFDYIIGLGPTYQGSENDGNVLFAEEQVEHKGEIDERYVLAYEENGRYPRVELITNKERRDLEVGENLRIIERDMKLYVKTNDDFLTYEEVNAEELENRIAGLSPKTGTAMVLTTDWEVDTTYSGYGYRASVSVLGLTADFAGLVSFDDTALALEILKEGGKTYSGGFYVYASEIPSTDITIESYIFWEVGNEF